MIDGAFSPDDWRASLSRGDIVVFMMPIEGPIGAARDVARQRCGQLLDAHPGHFASRSATPGLAAIALSRSARVGVDVERIDPCWTPDDALIDRALDPAERATIGAHDQAGFLRLWTCKESALKAAGVGLALPAASVHVGWRTDAWRCVDFGARASPAHVRSLAAPPGFAAAIATLDAPRDVCVVTKFVTHVTAPPVRL